MSEVEQLDAMTRAMAAALVPYLPTIDRAGYARFLQAMVQYTRHSGDRLRHAAEFAPTAALRAFFARLAVEESGHYQLAEADLRALGKPITTTQDTEIVAFHTWFMASNDPADWIGALYVLENVADHLAQDVTVHLGRLGLLKTQVRFVMTHLTADAAHGEDTRKHAEAHGQGLLPAAKRAADFWTRMHIQAFRALG